MKNLLVHLLLVIGLLMAGCISSEHPLLTPEQTIAVDRTLEGVWDAERFMVEIRVADEKSYTVTSSDGVGFTHVSTLRLGKIGELTVADVTSQPKPGEPASPPAHVFAVVHDMSPRLKISLLNPHWLEAYLKKHPTELAFEDEGEGKLVLQSPTTEIQALFVREAAHIEDEQIWIPLELKRVPGHQTLTTMPTTQRTEQGVVHDRTGVYTTRPLKRSELESKPFRDQLPADADEIQFANFDYWQSHEGYLSFRASKEACLAYAKAQVEDWNQKHPEEASPFDPKPIDKAQQQAFLESKGRGLGSSFRSIPVNVPAPWFTPENIREGVEIEHSKSDTKFWIDTERGILYRQYDD